MAVFSLDTVGVSARREGCSELMERLHAHDVPLLVFSAGLGNVIEEVLRQQAHIHDNVKIVSNMMSFNDQVHCVVDQFRNSREPIAGFRNIDLKFGNFVIILTC